ncbi:hypothetical protein TRFO_32577 [Tritrichomonas foetus]|uniref:Uncharacterized protein n=1 Tax=Tritrichomonas foetus TaxID=1144522 RepID=A0A1J4JT44_9EUKA|nr:hypothetical protein TRFO_32577 [Tritrichomonas foetus]|eukprot:OHT00668.1 hypothetical protein TRFO_32577 [Tritrichomonas foetus]
MASHFAPLCQTFEDQKSNISICDSVLQQFIRATQTDPNTLSELAVDPYLTRFIQIAFLTITRESFPSPTKGIIPPLIIQTLQFLTTLAFNHPDLQSAIATNAPLDQIPNIFFGKNFKNNKIHDPQSSHLLTPLRFLLSISASHSMNISSTSALHILFCSLFSLFDVSSLSAYAAGTLSGFVHNCPSAASYVRSLPNFASLKTELVSLLSANDHNIVVSAMSCLSALFQAGSDAPTLVQLAFHAINDPPSIPFAGALCCWTILDLIQQCSLSPKHVACIVNAILQSSGMRSFHLLSMLTEFHRIGINCLGVLLQKQLIIPLISFLIKTQYDYVSVAGTQYIQMLFEDQDNVPLGPDLSSVFTAALQSVVVCQPSTNSLLKTESMLLLLRIMLRCEESQKQILKVLAANQNHIFVGFQRHIEANHSFVAVNYFLFIHSIICLQKQWSTQLLHIIAESQFCALLVHVLTHSTSRVILNDALYASYLISSGLTGGSLHSSPLIDSMVSGFLVMNKENVHEKQQTIEKYESYQCSMIQKFRLVQTEKEKKTQELNELANVKENADKLIKSQEDNLHAANLEIQQLQNNLRNKNKKLKLLKENFYQISQENAQMKIEIQHKDDKIHEYEKTIEVLKSKVHGYKDIESQLRDEVSTRNGLISQVEQLRIELDNSRKEVELWTSTANNEKKGRTAAEEKLLNTSTQLSEMTIKFHEQETLTNENQKQIDRFEAMIKKKNERLNGTEDSNRQLRQQINELQEQITEFTKTTKHQKKYIEQLQMQISELESSNRDHTTLYQFIHKITENKGIIVDEYSDTCEC